MLYQVREGKTLTTHEQGVPVTYDSKTILDIAPEDFDQAIKAGILVPYKITTIEQPAAVSGPEPAPEPKAKVISPEDAAAMMEEAQDEPTVDPTDESAEEPVDEPVDESAEEPVDGTSDESTDPEFTSGTGFGG